jgi:hypothetical protein
MSGDIIVIPPGPAGALNVEISYAGVPAGGTAGQVLSKINSTDFNTQWVDGLVTSDTVVTLRSS